MKILHKPASLSTLDAGLKGLRGLLCAALLAPMAAMAQPGSLDPDFDEDGRATISFDGTVAKTTSASADDVAFQSDGKIVTAGRVIENFAIMGLARQNPDGSLDTGFGGDGRIEYSPVPGVVFTTAHTVLIQSDGKILAGGWRTVPSTSLLVRFNPDGSLDTGFGSNGEATGLSGLTIVEAVLQDDGKIVAALEKPSLNFYVARFLQDGSLDPLFGSAGLVTVDLSASISARTTSVAVQGDGRIVVGGTVDNNMAAIRLQGDGSLDGTFGTGGRQIIAPGTATGLAIQGDGKILICGFENLGSGEENYVAARLNTDGSPDTSFGAGTGLATVNITPGGRDRAHDIALQASGKIILAGESRNFSVPTGTFSLARLNSDGSLDTDFGNGGSVTTAFNDSSSTGFALTTQDDGKLVLAGSQFLSATGEERFAIARYLAGDPAEPLTYYLHGNDVPGTADGFTMDTNPPSPPQPLTLNLANAPTWYSEPTLSGSFAAGDFALSFPCALGISVATTYALHRTAPDGSSPELITSLTQPLQICTGMQTINLPVVASEGFDNQRLRLRISTLLGLGITLDLGEDVKLVTTKFAEGGGTAD